jgi:hypothetical protein
MHRLPSAIICSTLIISQPEQTQPPAKPEQPAKVRYEDLPPAVQLGLRTEAMQNAWPTLPVVVIAADTGSYIEAIGSWTPKARFPVLIDDGTPASREDIARFVRGFKPTRTVRWSGKVKAPEGAPLRDAVSAAVQRVWARAAPGEDKDAKVESQAELLARWKSIGVPRTGIVVAAHDDTAWTAALALAAGRAQPLVWIDRPPKSVDAAFTITELHKFESDLETACTTTGLSWNKLGDEIDSVAVCMGIPGRVQLNNTILAMTDMIGRAQGEKPDGGNRWAWTGQILGTESRAAYAAMCSLFLGTRKAWLFDGYERGKPWSDFDATAAAEHLNRAGLETSVNDAPASSEHAWRGRTALPIDAGLIAVNTKGMANEFHLEPGRCIPADVPILTVPSMVYFVHSWSALAPNDPSTVGCRWLERGAYAYMGSVDEPYLQAFVPTPIAMARLASKFPFAAAVRADERPGTAKAWKLTVLGDPLTMLGRGVPRVDEALPLAGEIDVQDDVKESLAKRNYAGAIRSLALQGRDADVADLIRVVLNEDAANLTAVAAEDAIMSLARRGELKTLAKAYALLPAPAARRSDLRDALWHAAYRALPESRDESLLSVLRLNIRDDARSRDSQELAEPFAALFGHDAAARMLAESRDRTSEPGDRLKIDTLIRRHQTDKVR